MGGLIGNASDKKSGLMSPWEVYRIISINNEITDYCIKIITIPIYQRIALFLAWGNETNQYYNSAILVLNNRSTNLLHVGKIRLSGQDKLFYKYNTGSREVSIYAKIKANTYSSVEGRIFASTYAKPLLLEKESLNEEELTEINI